MYDLSELDISGKEMAIAVLIVFVFLVGAFSAGYCVGSRTNVPDNGDGVKPISNELGQAGTAISNAGAGIEAAQGTADAISGTIADAQNTADYIAGTAKDSTELIGQCKSIIERIRQRGKAQKSNN